MSRKHLAALLPLLIYGIALADGIESVDRIRAAASRHVNEQLPGASVEAATLDSRLRVAQCAADLHTATFGTPANAAWTVAVSCSSPAWTLYVPVRISNEHGVLIATRNLRAGETLATDALSIQKRDTAKMPAGYVTDPQLAVGKVLRQPVAAGAPLVPDMLGAPITIRRGQIVTLLSRVGAIEVRAQGKALADGTAGDHISVENDSSQRVVEGRVGADGSVEVRS